MGRNSTWISGPRDSEACQTSRNDRAPCHVERLTKEEEAMNSGRDSGCDSDCLGLKQVISNRLRLTRIKHLLITLGPRSVVHRYNDEIFTPLHLRFMKRRERVSASGRFIPWIPTSDDTHPGSERVRKWTPKVRTGCQTCRRRRVKCDEQKPSCLRCSRLNLECRYDNVATVADESQTHGTAAGQQPRKVDNLGNSLTPIYGSAEENRYLNIYISNSAPWIARYADLAFFCEILPQTSWHHSTIKHALVAVAMASEEFTGVRQSVKPYRRLWHYNQALRHLISQDQRDQDVAMMACVLFFVHDNLMNQAKSAMLHFHAFLKMVAERRNVKIRLNQPHELEATILRNMTFWAHAADRTFAEPPDEKTIHQIRLKVANPAYAQSFDGLGKVREEALLFIRAIQWASANGKVGESDTRSITLDELEAFVKKWYYAFSGQPNVSRDNHLILECYFLCFRCVIYSHRPGGNMQATSQLSRLNTILDRVEALKITELGPIRPENDIVLPVIPVVLEVARQGATTAVRPRALRILRGLNRFETNWNSKVLVSMIESWAFARSTPHSRITVDRIQNVVEELEDDASRWDADQRDQDG